LLRLGELLERNRAQNEHSYPVVSTTYIQVSAVGTTKVNFRIPEELIEKADVAAKVTHKNRTDIVIEALRNYLDEIEDEEAFKEEIVELYLEGEVGFDVLRAFLGRQDAESIRASKTLLDDGEQLAVELADLDE